MTPEEKAEAIDKLAESISKLCHAVIRRRLGQFFEVIEEEMAKRPRCGACSPAEVGGPTCACSTQETVPAPEASIIKAFERSPRRVQETFACLGGCGASVLGPNAYCSACFLAERRKAETSPAPPCFWCGCEKDHPDHKFGAGKNHAYRVGSVVTQEEREAYALNRGGSL